MLLACMTVGTQAADMQNMVSSGSAELKRFWIPVYKAELFTTNGEYRFFETAPFSLVLTYHLSFKGRQLVAETRRQWEKLGFDQARGMQWLSKLSDIFPDINKGDKLSLYVDNNLASHFLYNGDEIGTIESAEFSEQFSAIWLSPKATDADFTAALLGEK